MMVHRRLFRAFGALSLHGAPSTSLGARSLQMLEVLDNGTVTEVHLTVSALRDETCVGVRELLQVERPLSSSTQPRILPRERSTPFHLGSARGVIFPSKVLLFTAPNLSSIPAADIAATLAEHIKRTDTHCFEHRALEGLLWAMASRQEKRVAYVSRVLATTLHSTHRSEADEESPLLTLLPLSTTLAHYEHVSRGLMQCVRSLLDSEEELRCLGRGSESRVEELEDLLEAVHHSAAGTTLAASEMTRQLGIKRDLLQLHQRAYQNSLLTTNLQLTKACLAFSGAMWCTSLFGQNLQSGLEGLGQLAFLGATASSMAVGGALYTASTRGSSSSGSGIGRGSSASSSRSHPRRLESLQAFLLQLDVRLDAAKSTLTAASQQLAASPPGERLSKDAFCKLHCQLTPEASLAEAELLFDVLDSGNYGGELSLEDLHSLETLLHTVEDGHTIRAGVSSKRKQVAE
jgi:hypothetical protein